ncbi:type II toxin-antitoxin system VapC family toxin [Glycomyces terrestris]|uniref:Ribonuclease VapC n=1 Tax=Glycomyces terrestris TaxID=2493553 RepID=A0A426V1L9_9ACTN|nr:type II toxin-antitoxin system VapC family toxin [Glycomyces terrestris]RRS00750.1 PIN domain-containing protein [Glycomyces terrestris]
MNELVVDNSLIIYVLLEGNGNDLLRRRLSAPRTLHAPNLIDYEFGHALRGLLIGGKITEADADSARTDFADLPIRRYPGSATADRAWALRHNFTVYDASYIALAELLGAPLLTGDAKLLGAHHAHVELVPG